MTNENKDMKNTFGKFYVDGQWKVIKKKCSTCCYVKHFNKRADEPSNMGCNKPGWEGYTFENDMACGGSFYFPNAQISVGIPHAELAGSEGDGECRHGH